MNINHTHLHCSWASPGAFNRPTHPRMYIWFHVCEMCKNRCNFGSQHTHVHIHNSLDGCLVVVSIRRWADMCATYTHHTHAHSYTLTYIHKSKIESWSLLLTNRSGLVFDCKLPFHIVTAAERWKCGAHRQINVFFFCYIMRKDWARNSSGVNVMKIRK